MTHIHTNPKIMLIQYIYHLPGDTAIKKDLRGFWISWDFPLILGEFLCILGFYNRNEFKWGGVNPETSLNMPMHLPRYVKYLAWDYHNCAGCGGSLVDSTPFVHRVMGFNHALAAT